MIQNETKEQSGLSLTFSGQLIFLMHPRPTCLFGLCQSQRSLGAVCLNWELDASSLTEERAEPRLVGHLKKWSELPFQNQPKQNLNISPVAV